MSLLLRTQPSGRLSSSDLLQKRPYGVSQRVSTAMFFGASLQAITPRLNTRDAVLIHASALLPYYDFKRALQRVQPSYRVRSVDLTPKRAYSLGFEVANKLFFGSAHIEFTLGIEVFEPIAFPLLHSTAITLTLISVLDPPVAVSLVDVDDLSLLTLSLAFSRPKSFLAATGGDQVGYAQ